MKKILLSLCVCLSWVAAQGQVIFDSYAYDLGTINEVDGVVEHTFTYKNEGDKPFVITSVSVSCGCTTPSYSSQPLKKNETGKFVVRFDPTDRPGRFEKMIYLTTNEKKIVLVLKGVVNPRERTVQDDYPFLIASDIRLAALAENVERASVGRRVVRTIGVVNASLSASAVLGVEVVGEAPWLKAEVSKSMLAAGERGEIVLEIEGRNFGLNQADVELIINGATQAEKIWVSAIFTRDFSGVTSAEVRDGAKAEYSSYFYHFSGQKLGDKLARTFEIRNVGTQELIIDHVEASSDELTFTLGKRVLKAGEKTTLKITALPTADGVFSETVRVITSDIQYPVREIRIMANII